MTFRSLAPPGARRPGWTGIDALMGGGYGCAGWRPRSDGEGEFGKGRWEPLLWVKFPAEFVVTAAEVLDECVSSTDHAGRAEPCEATHGPESGREQSLIGLDGIIPVLLHDVARGRP